MICGIQWVSELISIAGGTDVFADRAAGRSAEDRKVSESEVAARDPEVMFASWCGKPLDREAVYARDGLKGVSAIEKDRLFEVPPEIILQPGPACLTDGLDFLERCIENCLTA